MKKTLLATTLMLATGLSTALMAAPANDDTPPPRDGSMHERGFERMAEELSLTDEQKTQLQQIREEERTKFQTLREESKARFDAVLTAEQRQKMEQLHEQRRERMQERREGRPPRGEPCHN
ncbi:MAG: Spy/CpxP family protein refolding chaperone [Pseudomonadaceae bacterium]